MYTVESKRHVQIPLETMNNEIINIDDCMNEYTEADIEFDDNNSLKKNKKEISNEKNIYQKVTLDENFKTEKNDNEVKIKITDISRFLGSNPLLDCLRDNWRELIIVFFTTSFWCVNFYTTFVWIVYFIGTEALIGGTHVHMNVCMYVYIKRYVCICIHVYKCTHIFTHIYICGLCILLEVYMYICMYVYMYIYIKRYVFICFHVYKCTHICTHIYICGLCIL
jgi:hypothetical protein